MGITSNRFPVAPFPRIPAPCATKLTLAFILFFFRNVTMPPPPRHRVSTSARPSATTPMSERQQMALLMQMTSSSEAGKSSGLKQSRNNKCCYCSILELSPNSQTVKPKDRNERGETALHICAKKGDLEAAKKLLESGVSPNVTDFAGKYSSLQLKLPVFLIFIICQAGLPCTRPLTMVTWRPRSSSSSTAPT